MTRHVPGLAASTLWPDEPGRNLPQPLRARWDPVPPQNVRAPRRQTARNPRRSSLGWFLHHYGWRAYALPVLVVLTVFTLVGLVNNSTSGQISVLPQHPPVPTPDQDGGQVGPASTPNDSDNTLALPELDETGKDDDNQLWLPIDRTGPPIVALADLSTARVADDVPPIPDVPDSFAGVSMGMLPPGAPFAVQGAKNYHVVPGTTQPFGEGNRLRTFTIEVEDGIQTTADDVAFADDVVTILSDERSWAGGDFQLQRIDAGTPDFRITLTSQLTIRGEDECGWDVQLEASCYNRLPGRVFINDARWARGAFAFAGDLASYRFYAINHEVGHALGFNHEPCVSDGGVAPVMMPQSWSTSNDDIALLSPEGPIVADGLTCRANPFSYPDN